MIRNKVLTLGNGLEVQVKYFKDNLEAIILDVTSTSNEKVLLDTEYLENMLWNQK